MRYLLPFILLLFFCLPAVADVRFMQLGDPQFGKTCAVAGSANGRYLGLSRADCIAEQRRNLHGLLQYASDININHVIFMGDQNENIGQADEEIAFAAEIALFPDLEFHYVIGNHETAADCTGMPDVLLDPYGLGSGIPHWQSFSIGHIYFFIANAQITSYDNINCYNLDDGVCVDDTLPIGGESGACDANPTDAAGVGTCAAGYTCRRYEDYAVAQEAALTTAVAAYNTAYIAGTAKAFFFVSHIALWNQNNADVAAIDDGIHQWHNMRTCTGGANDGLYCNDKAGYDCPAGACNVDVANRQWRSQAETILAGLSTTALGLFGHTHTNTVWSGTTVNGTDVDYSFVISTGTSIPYPEATWWTDLTGNIWTCDMGGVCTYDTILATPQSVEIYGEIELFGVSIP